MPTPENGKRTGAGPPVRASPSNKDVSPQRQSLTGAARQSQSKWGPGQGQGQSRTSVSSRRSYRHSTRRSIRSGMGGGGEQGTERVQQVIDPEDGTDRTPKPLLSLKPTVLGSKGLPGMDDPPSPASEMSDYFMDRMSSAGLSKGGWFSEASSGVSTPKSEHEEEENAAKEQARKAEEEAAAAEEAEKAERKKKRKFWTPPEPSGPELLSESDLEQYVCLALTETNTDFLLELPGITVAADTDEALVVEAANARYAAALAAKAAADRYTDAAAQTLDLLKKSREVQCSGADSCDVGCDASVWDMADTYGAVGQVSSGKVDEAAAQHIPNISQLAGAAQRGDGYISSMPAPPSNGNSGAWSQSSHRVTGINAWLGSESMRQRDISSRQTNRESNMSMTSWRGGILGGRSGGLMNSGVGQSVSMTAVGGAPLPTSGAESEAPPDPLQDLMGLLEALHLMDCTITQNIYLSKLLLYRNARPAIDPASSQPSPDPPVPGTADTTAASRLGSPGQHSRPGSRYSARSPEAGGSRGGLNMTANSNTLGRASVLGPQGSLMEGGSVAGDSDDGVQDFPGIPADELPGVQLLWRWSCEATQDLAVASLAWNKARPDLLAVGYSSRDPSDTKEPRGLVAFWSIKNPTYPLGMLACTAGVTALAFSGACPNLLAVGLYDGNIAIYDVKSRQASPAMQSDTSSGRHSDPVWKVRWLDRGPERDEVLISISTDGRVTQWSIAKGLEFSDLMKLKRVPRRKGPTHTPTPAATTTANGQVGGAKAGAGAGLAPPAIEQDAFISRLTSGMAFDFSATDPRIYLAGTEDGWVHRCSTSYSEQYLDSYSGHKGPVYQVQWSPFSTQLFMSCSADWTVRLWQEGREAPLLTFMTGHDEIHDVQWCPTNSSVFGAVTSGGRLEIWDFSLSTLKPVAQHRVPGGYKLSCLLFSPNSPVVVCGGDGGEVLVLRLFNVDREYDSPQEQLTRLQDAITANVMKTAPGQVA